MKLEIGHRHLGGGSGGANPSDRTPGPLLERASLLLTLHASLCWSQRMVTPARALKGRKKLAGGKRSAAPGHTQPKRRAPEGRRTVSFNAPAPPSGRMDYKPPKPRAALRLPGANFRRPSGANSPRAMRCEHGEVSFAKLRRSKLPHSKVARERAMAMAAGLVGNQEPVRPRSWSHRLNSVRVMNCVRAPNISRFSNDSPSGTTSFKPVSYKSPPGSASLGNIF